MSGTFLRDFTSCFSGSRIWDELASNWEWLSTGYFWAGWKVVTTILCSKQTNKAWKGKLEVRLLLVGFYRWQVIWLSQEIGEIFFVYGMNLCTLKPGSVIPTGIVLFSGYCKIAHINNVWLCGMICTFKCCSQHHSFRILGHGPQYFQNEGFWETAAKWILLFFKTYSSSKQLLFLSDTTNCICVNFFWIVSWLSSHLTQFPVLFLVYY